MVRSIAAALACALLVQDPADSGSEKSKLHEELAVAAEGAGEQLIKLKSWDEARAFLELIRAKSDARAEALDKLIAKTDKQTSGLKWDAKSSDLIKSFGSERAKKFFAFARAWKEKDAEAARWTQAEGEILDDLLDYVKAYARLTQIRAHYELPKTRFDWKLSVPAVWHAKYLVHNPDDPREIQGKTGFTNEGQECAKKSVSSRAESLNDLVESLVHAPFHRAFVMQPRLLHTGFGQAHGSDQTGVMDVQSGLGPPDATQDSLLRVPRDGSIDVPTRGYDDSTRIVENVSMKDLGYPVSLVFYSASDQPKNIKAQITESLRVLDVYISTPDAPAIPKQYPTNRNMILLVPKNPLKPLTTYNVRVEFTLRGEKTTASWSFRTGR